MPGYDPAAEAARTFYARARKALDSLIEREAACQK